MIRINLLPVPKVRKQEALIVQLVTGIAILAFVAIACYFVAIGKRSTIGHIQSEIQDRERQITELKAKVGEVEKYKKQAQALEEQLSVIRSLEAGRSGPVKMMDELTDLVPRKLWVSNFREQNKKVTIEGTADSGAVIADFLDNLKTSKYFSNIQLNIVQAADSEGLKLHKFTITATVKYDI